MKQNYQTETDSVIKALGGERKKLLLQCCCGPCSSYVLEYLTGFFDVTALFYNPNIQPQAEYLKRLHGLEMLLERYDDTVRLMPCDYEGECFDSVAKGLEAEPEGGARCAECFRLRLSQTAKRAKDEGFDYFCTTLTVSPHKDAYLLNEIGLALEKEFEVRWLPSDFKKLGGYQRSTTLAREYGLYRQDYCGCLFSLAETQRRQAENNKDSKGL